MFDKIKYYLIILILLVIAFLLYKNYTAIQALNKEEKQIEQELKTLSEKDNSYELKRINSSTSSDSDSENQSTQADELSSEEAVIPYIKSKGQLPDYYITKKEARENGWVASKGNLCEALPGRIIGGDVFTNRQKSLPIENGRIYYEADLNYSCGRRGKDRVVFSNDGLIFVTYDHYDSFEER